MVVPTAHVVRELSGREEKKRYAKVSLWRVRKQLLTVVPASSGLLKHLSP